VPQKRVIHDWVGVSNMQTSLEKISVPNAAVTDNGGGNINFTDFADPVDR
jgi:hypothetical protein